MGRRRTLAGGRRAPFTPSQLPSGGFDAADSPTDRCTFLSALGLLLIGCGIFDPSDVFDRLDQEIPVGEFLLTR